ncbi:MAG: HAD family hydrolase [Christensenellales bacterium]|nr:HAD family hydrolase [Christensenellales bacterium]
MQEIKLFLTDLDGTLLQDDHATVSDRTRRALSALKRQGVCLCACTGRVRCVLPPAVEELGFDYAITSNGAACDDLRTGKRVFAAYMPAERARAAWEYLAPTGCLTEWYVQGDILMDSANHAEWPGRLKAPWHRKYLGAGNGIVVDNIHDFFRRGAPGLEKISIFDCPADIGSRAIEPMLATGKYEISTSLGINFEITDISANKGNALEKLCAHLRISPEQAIAFGDGSNDVTLLTAAGIGVAMDNATPLVKRRAAAVTDANMQDGVARYLETHVLA